MSEAEPAEHPNLEMLAAVAWLALAVAAAIFLLAPARPYAAVLVGAALAFIAPEHDRPGWWGFVPASIVRIADTVLFAAVAWSLGRLDDDLMGAAAAVSLLSAGLLSAYVRIRATSLGIISRAGGAFTGIERGVRLALVGAGLAGPLVPMLWTATALSLLLAGSRSVGVWRNA